MAYLKKPYIQLNQFKFKYLKWLWILSLIFISHHSYATGFRVFNITDEGYKDVYVGVWYPSNANKTAEFGLKVNQMLVEGSPSVTSAPLIVLSHGYGGWMGGHANTALALAQAGFVVAAPSHTGNTFKDMSSPINQWLVDRPRHVTKIIDYLTNQWEYREILQDTNVGAFGFSAGGQTVLSLIGAVPNLKKAAKHCKNQPTEFVCKQGMVSAMLEAEMDQLASWQWGIDKRIKAAVIAAPGLGIAYDKKALSKVSVNVQIWSGLLDRRVPHKSNAQPIANALGSLSESHWVKLAGHFAFMLQPCNASLKKHEPKTWVFLCTDEKDFDRRVFHDEMNSEIVHFFKQHLKMQVNK